MKFEEALELVKEETKPLKDGKKGCVLVDIDDCILKADGSQISIIKRKPGEPEKRLSSEEYAKDPDAGKPETKKWFSYEEFRDPKKVFNSIVNGTPQLRQLRLIDQHVRAQWDIAFLTARGLQDVVDKALREFLKFRDKDGRLQPIGDNLKSGISAAVDPVQDACFVKLPYWSFTEAGYNHYTLNNKTTSGGQALGIGRNFESAFLKALQSTTGFSNNVKTFKKEYKKSEKELLQDLSKPNEIHLITLLAAIAKGINYHTLHQLLHIHLVFLQKFNHILILLKKLRNDELTADLMLKVKKNGFSNRLIAEITQRDEKSIADLCKKWSIKPSYIEIDGTAGLIHPNIQAV